MGENGREKNSGLSTDRISLGIAILALAVSAFTLYYQFLQGPVVRAYRPNVVYLTKSQIGIPVAFTNTGTATDVVTDGSLKLTRNGQPEQALKLAWVSPFEKRISLEDGKWKEEAREYLPFSHLPLKAGDTDQEVFWFVPSSSFTFQPGPYRACASFFAVSEGMVRPGAKAGRPPLKEECSAWVEFELNTAQADTMGRSDQESVPIETK